MGKMIPKLDTLNVASKRARKPLHLARVAGLRATCCSPTVPLAREGYVTGTFRYSSRSPWPELV